MKPVLRNILGVVLLILIVTIYFVRVESTDILGFDPLGKNNDQSILINFLASIIPMLIGVFFSALFNQIKDKQGAISYRQEIADVFKSPHLLKALLLAPLLLTGIFTFAGSSPDTITTLLFAFQNGFFCETVLKEKKREA